MFFKERMRSWTTWARGIAVIGAFAVMVTQTGCLADQPHEPEEEGSYTAQEVAALDPLPEPAPLEPWVQLVPNVDGEARPLPAWLVIAGIIMIGGLIWAGYSSGWDFEDEETARAAAKEHCGSAVLVLCEREFTPPPGKEWTGKATYSYTISWRLFFTGWWYRFTCEKDYECEVRCKNAGAEACGACPNPNAECCQAKPACGES